VLHLFYTEEVQNYQVSFKRLPDVKKKFFETTLLDNLQLCPERFNYRNLPLAVTVRCAPFHAVKARYMQFKLAKYLPVVAFDDMDSGLRDWPKDFKYNQCIGNVEENAMTRFEIYTEQRVAAQQSEQPKETNQTVHQPQTPKASRSQSGVTSTSASRDYTPHAGETQRWVLNQDQASSSSSVQGQSDNESSNKSPNSEFRHCDQQSSLFVFCSQLACCLLTIH
jgi:hypothetical protein